MKNTQKKYHAILKGQFSELGYFADQMIEAETDHDFFRICCVSVMPLLNQSKAFEFLRFQWLESIAEYNNKRAILEQKIREEVANSFRSLVSLLERENILQEPAIQTILESKKYNALEVDFMTLVRRIKELCTAVLDLGLVALLKDYAVVRYIDKYQPSNKHGYVLQAYSCVDCGYVYDDESAPKCVNKQPISFEMLDLQACPICRCRTDYQPYQHQTFCSVPVIDKFIFAPLLDALFELDRFYSWDKEKEAWVAFDRFRYAEWCWNTAFSYFDNHTLDFINDENHKQSLQSLQRHMDWTQMNIIKEQKDYDRRAFFFTRKRFTRYLTLILDQIILAQATNDIEEVPYSLELGVVQNQLLLYVGWDSDVKIEAYKLRNKFVEGSGPRQFLCSFLEKKNVESCDATELGASVSQFLGRLNLKGVLSALFFSERTNKVVVFRSKYIVVADVPDVNLKALVTRIKKLKLYKPD